MLLVVFWFERYGSIGLDSATLRYLYYLSYQPRVKPYLKSFFEPPYHSMSKQDRNRTVTPGSNFTVRLGTYFSLPRLLLTYR
jgi:hypothetical protein